MHGMSKSSIYFLNSSSGSLTKTQTLVSYSLELNGFEILIWIGFGLGLDGTYLNVKVKNMNGFSLANNLFFYFLLKGIVENKKIQSKYPKASDYIREIGFSTLTIFIFGVVPLVFIHNQNIIIYRKINRRINGNATKPLF